MGPKNRLKFILLGGIIFWSLILHNFYWYRIIAVLKQESISYLLARVSQYWLVALFAAILFLFAIIFAFSIIFKRTSRADMSHHRLLKLLIPLAALFFLSAPFLLFINYRGIPPIEWSAPVSVLVLISIVLFTIISRRKWLIISHLVLFMIALAAFIMPNLSSTHRDQLKTIKMFIDQEQKRLSACYESFCELDPSSWPIENFKAELDTINFYRLDDNIAKASIVEASPYNPEEGILFQLQKSESVSSIGGIPSPKTQEVDGALILSEYKGGTVLKICDNLGLDPDSIGSFTIKMKVTSGRYFRVFWNEGNIFDPDVYIQVPLLQRGDFQAYDLKEAVQSLSRVKQVKKIDQIFLLPSNQDSKIQIESLKILNLSSSVCRKTPIDSGYENLRGEIRKVLYTRSPSTIVYEVSIPDGDPHLRFGSASADPSIPVLFQVFVKEGSKEILLFTEKVEGRQNWKNHALDLGRWAGQTLQITLRTASERSNVAFWSNPLLLNSHQNKANVVIYLVDALRADHLGIYGYGRDTTPNLDRFAQRGAIFEKAYSNGCSTLHSIPSLFTSNPISATGIRSGMNSLSDAFPTLAETLRVMGYKTAAFVTNYNTGEYTGTHKGFSQIFEKHFLLEQEEGAKEIDAKLDIDKLIGQTLENWIEDNAHRNFFLFIHTMDAHGPYNPPEEYRSFLEDSGQAVHWRSHLDPQWLKNPTVESRTALYDGEIAYGDVYFNDFLKKLENHGILENTIIVFTADHGEYFGEHGLWGHHPPPYVQGTHIPLIFVWPGKINEGIRISQNVQLMDVMPTVMNILGFDHDHPLLQGNSLHPLMQVQEDPLYETRPIYVESARKGQASIHFSRFHFITEKNLLFDLSSDPKENHYINKFLFHFRLKAKLRQLARQYDKTYSLLHDRMFQAEEDTIKIDQETLNQLRALGYID
jgi:arylsulfatase A-like enzyme